jgi:DNA mismatch repair protein PMS2
VKYDQESEEICRKTVSVEFSLDKIMQKYDKKVTTEDKNSAEKSGGRQFLASLASHPDTGNAEHELSRHLHKDHFQTGSIIGQFNLGFIIVRLLQDDLFIIDQHASDEKFRFEALLKETRPVSQPLVLAQDLELDAGRKELLLDNIEIFEKLGFGFLTNAQWVESPSNS